MQALAAHQREAVRRVLAQMKSRPGPLLEVLHGIQHDLGHIPAAAVPLIAEELNLSRAEVHGVISFYHHFRSAPPGRHTVQICRAESCQAMGAAGLAEHAKRRLGIELEQTTADGSISLESVYCLGQCACSPAIMIDQEVFGRVTPEGLDALLAEHAGPEKASGGGESK
ncbi:MAG: formate dehydrogenase subunit gamma [Steroidobacteraceae bacterium]